MATCSKCGNDHPQSELLISPDGAICQTCNLDAGADELLAAALMKRAGAALVLAVAGGPIKVMINGLNVVALAAAPIAMILASLTAVQAAKAKAKNALYVAVLADLVATIVLVLALWALMGR